MFRNLPEAHAQSRVSLTSLQAQIDKILSGELQVGAAQRASEADEAAHAVVADEAISAETLGGFFAHDYQKISDPVQWSNLQGVPEGFADGEDGGNFVAFGLTKVLGGTILLDSNAVKSLSFDTVDELRAVLDSVYAPR